MRFRLVAAAGLVGLLVFEACSSESTNVASAGGTSGSAGSGIGGTSGSGGVAGSPADAGDGGPPGCSFTVDTAPTCPPMGMGSAAKLLLNVAFEDHASTQAPSVGSLVWPGDSSLQVSDFGPGACGSAAHFGSPSQYVDYPEKYDATSTTAIIDYAQGTVMFWYRPDADPLADTSGHTLVRSTNVAALGGIWIDLAGKYLQAHAAAPGDAGASSLARVSLVACTLAPGKWAHIAMSWEVGSPARVFAGGIEVPPTAYASLPKATPDIARAPSETEKLEVGRHAAESANGWIDDLRIYDRAAP